MKLLLLGATGRTGRIVLKKSLEDGHEVSVIARDPSRIINSNIKITEGTPYDIDTVKKAAENCEAVISTINISRKSDNPWAKLISPKDLISRSVANALEAMKVNNIKRIITLSALGAGDSKEKMPFLFNLFISLCNLKYAFNDHTIQEELLKRSDTNWTAIRLPLLNNETGESDIIINKNDKVRLNKYINRESVARFILSVLQNEEFYRSIVGISYK